MDKEILKDNVRMVLDTNYTPNVESSLIENSWEILNVSNMNTFVFPEDYKTNTNSKEEGGNRCWCPSQIDIAIVFKTIDEANKKSQDESSLPINRCPSFIKEKDYVSEDNTKGIANRPCGFLTPRETLMPMPLIPTKNYIQNGLVLFSKLDEKEKQEKSLTVNSEYNNCFNWVIKTKEDYNDSEYDGTNPYDEMCYYGQKVSTQEDFTFINTSKSIHSNEKEINSRYYFLNDFIKGNNNFFYTIPNGNEIGKDGLRDVVSESLIFSSSYGGAFAFCYNFNGVKSGENEKNKPYISLKMNQIEATIPQIGNIQVKIEKNRTDGSVSNSKNSQKMGQLTENTFKEGNMLIFYPVWNGVAISGGIDDASRVKDSKGTINVTVDNGFVAYKNKDVEMSDFCTPTIKIYNTSKPTPMVVNKMTNDKKQSVEIQWGSCLDFRTINCLTNFAYTPVFFQKNLSFSLYIRDSSGKDLKTAIEDELKNQTRNHYLYPIYFSNDANYTVPSKVKGTKIIFHGQPDPNTGHEPEEEVYYRFDFNFSNTVYQRRGIEIFGFFHQVVVENKKREMSNENGIIELKQSENGYINKFNKSYNEYKEIISNKDNDWIKFATDISVNRTSEQSGGNITLDKYAFLGQFENPPQPVGEIRIKAEGGNKLVYKGNNVYFTGIGIGISYQDAAQQDTMSLNLHGIEKKLQEIKLAGSPYFDGDPIKNVMDYLSEYANFNYEFNNDFCSYTYDEQGNVEKKIIYPSCSPDWMKGGNSPCPRSVEFKRPAINFLLGTTVYEAIKMVCEKTNKTFFVTKEGIVRIVDQNIYGVPINISYSLKNNKPSYNLNSSQILNISLNPYFENVYNQVVTASLKGKRKGSNFPTLLNTDDMMPNILYTKIDEKIFGENSKHIMFPWSRMIVNNEQAILSPEEAKKVHEVNCNQYVYTTFNGGITIPGNADLEIFDTISIDDSKEIFYISGINHNYNSSSRIWTTSLQVSYIPEELATSKLTVFNEDPNPRY